MGKAPKEEAPKWVNWLLAGAATVQFVGGTALVIDRFFNNPKPPTMNIKGIDGNEGKPKAKEAKEAEIGEKSASLRTGGVVEGGFVDRVTQNTAHNRNQPFGGVYM